MGKGRNGEGLAICGAACICCCFVGIGLALLGLGIAKIVMGAIHLHDCPLQDKVPIWLIVSGVAPIFFGGSARKEEEDGEASQSIARSVCGIIGLLFNLAWLICGSVWVYPTYGTVNKDDFVPCIGNVTTGCSQDCHKPTLTFAFAMVTVDWIFFALWLTIIMCSVRALCARSR
ncbi:transmembrane protein 272-like [Mya arenaria]|uniref:transmembrane protein 272-like n=1 Tax=Mya arenaria TaxID=6604 RepID=UPI0022E3B8A8|nr:transmembrane protein 272-like [Mya arenaria]